MLNDLSSVVSACIVWNTLNHQALFANLRLVEIDCQHQLFDQKGCHTDCGLVVVQFFHHTKGANFLSSQSARTTKTHLYTVLCMQFQNTHSIGSKHQLFDDIRGPSLFFYSMWIVGLITFKNMTKV